MTNKDIESAIKTLRTEANGLSVLADHIDKRFSKAVDIIDTMKRDQDSHANGRLIIAGIGKSGHVARKIAATLASTGTPSYFVHPGEASHGDMGMITEADIVLMLSNSGENSELSDLIHYTRRYGIQLIAMTSNENSTLGNHADIVLLMPKVSEACPNGLAPTTSSTMMMAYGDALAVALLDRMGLTPEQFKVFHPGGKLGQRLQKVSDLMIKRDDLPIIAGDMTMDEAILVLTEKNMGAVIILDDQKALQGIITDGDLKRNMGSDLLSRPAHEIMSTSPKSITGDALAVEAVDVMTKTPGQYLTGLLVMDAQGNLSGMIRLQDCLQAGIV